MTQYGEYGLGQRDIMETCAVLADAAGIYLGTSLELVLKVHPHAALDDPDKLEKHLARTHNNAVKLTKKAAHEVGSAFFEILPAGVQLVDGQWYLYISKDAPLAKATKEIRRCVTHTKERELYLLYFLVIHNPSVSIRDRLFRRMACLALTQAQSRKPNTVPRSTHEFSYSSIPAFDLKAFPALARMAVSSRDVFDRIKAIVGNSFQGLRYVQDRLYDFTGEIDRAPRDFYHAYACAKVVEFLHSDKGGPFFSIMGGPGTAKTTILRYVLSQRRTMGHEDVCFFINAGDGQRGKPQRVFEHLAIAANLDFILQIQHHFPDDERRALEIFELAIQKRLRDSHSRDLVVFIDALDETEGNTYRQASVTSLLLQMKQNRRIPRGVRFVVTSCPTQTFLELVEQPDIDLDTNQAYREAIQTFYLHTFKKVGLTLMPEQFSLLLRSTRHSFLLATIHSKRIIETRGENIARVLSSGLENFIEEEWNKVLDRSPISNAQTSMIFAVVAAYLGRLTVEELSQIAEVSTTVILECLRRVGRTLLLDKHLARTVGPQTIIAGFQHPQIRRHLMASTLGPATMRIAHRAIANYLLRLLQSGAGNSKQYGQVFLLHHLVEAQEYHLASDTAYAPHFLAACATDARKAPLLAVLGLQSLLAASALRDSVGTVKSFALLAIRGGLSYLASSSLLMRLGLTSEAFATWQTLADFEKRLLEWRRLCYLMTRTSGEIHDQLWDSGDYSATASLYELACLHPSILVTFPPITWARPNPRSGVTTADERAFRSMLIHWILANPTGTSSNYLAALLQYCEPDCAMTSSLLQIAQENPDIAVQIVRVNRLWLCVFDQIQLSEFVAFFERVHIQSLLDLEDFVSAEYSHIEGMLRLGIAALHCAAAFDPGSEHVSQFIQCARVLRKGEENQQVTVSNILQEANWKLSLVAARFLCSTGASDLIPWDNLLLRWLEQLQSRRSAVDRTFIDPLFRLLAEFAPVLAPNAACAPHILNLIMAISREERRYNEVVIQAVARLRGVPRAAIAREMGQADDQWLPATLSVIAEDVKDLDERLEICDSLAGPSSTISAGHDLHHVLSHSSATDFRTHVIARARLGLLMAKNPAKYFDEVFSKLPATERLGVVRHVPALESSQLFATLATHLKAAVNNPDLSTREHTQEFEQYCRGYIQDAWRLTSSHNVGFVPKQPHHAFNEGAIPHPDIEELFAFLEILPAECVVRWAGEISTARVAITVAWRFWNPDFSISQSTFEDLIRSLCNQEFGGNREALVAWFNNFDPLLLWENTWDWTLLWDSFDEADRSVAFKDMLRPVVATILLPWDQERAYELLVGSSNLRTTLNNAPLPLYCLFLRIHTIRDLESVLNLFQSRLFVHQIQYFPKYDPRLDIGWEVIVDTVVTSSTLDSEKLCKRLLDYQRTEQTDTSVFWGSVWPIWKGLIWALGVTRGDFEPILLSTLSPFRTNPYEIDKALCRSMVNFARFSQGTCLARVRKLISHRNIPSLTLWCDIPNFVATYIMRGADRGIARLAEELHSLFPKSDVDNALLFALPRLFNVVEANALVEATVVISDASLREKARLSLAKALPSMPVAQRVRLLKESLESFSHVVAEDETVEGRALQFVGDFIEATAWLPAALATRCAEDMLQSICRHGMNLREFECLKKCLGLRLADLDPQVTLTRQELSRIPSVLARSLLQIALWEPESSMEVVRNHIERMYSKSDEPAWITNMRENGTGNIVDVIESIQCLGAGDYPQGFTQKLLEAKRQSGGDPVREVVLYARYGCPFAGEISRLALQSLPPEALQRLKTELPPELPEGFAMRIAEALELHDPAGALELIQRSPSASEIASFLKGFCERIAYQPSSMRSACSEVAKEIVTTQIRRVYDREEGDCCQYAAIIALDACCIEDVFDLQTLMVKYAPYLYVNIAPYFIESIVTKALLPDEQMRKLYQGMVKIDELLGAIAKRASV